MIKDSSIKMSKVCCLSKEKRGESISGMKRSFILFFIISVSASVFFAGIPFAADEKQIQEELPQPEAVMEQPAEVLEPSLPSPTPSSVDRPSEAVPEKNTSPGTASIKEVKGQLRLDFNKADIRTFIKYISDHTGKNFIIDEKVKGFVTVHSPQAETRDEA